MRDKFKRLNNNLKTTTVSINQYLHPKITRMTTPSDVC